MARIRSIKPSFFKSDDVSVLPLRARLTWIGLWTQCDDQGRTKDHARLIKADIWPLDTVTLSDIEEDLSTLADCGRIVRYEVEGKRYLAITNWSDHQKIDRPSKSTLPAPPTNGHRALTDNSSSPRAGKGGEGNGKEGTRDALAREADGEALSEPPDSVPPQRCSKHLTSRNPPACGPCGDARREHNRWQKAYNDRIAASPKCVLHRGEVADNCRVCRSEELSPA